MKTIQLTQEQVALVDDEDYLWLNKWKWCASKSPHDNTYYATRIEYIPGGKGKLRKTLKMHRVILGLTNSKLLGDHRDHNGLNNQKSNLRIATVSQNKMNVNSYKNSTSKYLGVHWHKESKKWKAALKFNGKQFNLGIYTDEKLAAKTYNDKSKELYGEFANLNII